jgi:hypothetical protein
MKSIADKAEISIDFPDKTYVGAFGRESSFDVKIEADDVLLRIVRPGPERREFAIHLHYHLLADILTSIGDGLVEHPELAEANVSALREASESLAKSLKVPAGKKRKR